MTCEQLLHRLTTYLPGFRNTWLRLRSPCSAQRAQAKKLDDGALAANGLCMKSEMESLNVSMGREGTMTGQPPTIGVMENQKAFYKLLFTDRGLDVAAAEDLVELGMLLHNWQLALAAEKDRMEKSAKARHR